MSDFAGADRVDRQHLPLGGEPAPTFPQTGELHNTETNARDLERFVRELGLRVFVETGLWRGYGSGMALVAAGLLDRYFAIEVEPESCRLALLNCPSAIIYCGDSAERLPLVLAELDGPAVFWFDAHEVTDPVAPFPTMAELAHLAEWPHAARSGVAIDDLTMMGHYPGWCTLPDLRAYVDALDLWDRSESEHLMYLRPRV